MLRHYFLYIVSVLAVLSTSFSCEKYEKTDENSPFSISARTDILETPEGKGSVALDVLIMSGVTTSKCVLELRLSDKQSGATPDYKLYLADGTALLDGAEWRFDQSGSARFILTELPKGEYTAEITVKRWYHSASCSTEFKF